MEAYLDLPPLANAQDEFILDLLFCEWMVRQECGELPRADEYVRRFPKLADSLTRLFALDAAFLGDYSIAAEKVKEGTALQRIGKYPIVSLLAEGGQSVVYRALHPTLGKEVIIKWSKQPIAVAGERDQLVAEGQVLARVDHPNLVRVFDLDFHEGRPFLVMEALQASTLEHYRDRANPDPRRSAKMIAQIARVLDEVHRKGIVHRDIKPRNILIDEKDQPKLIDFGLACGMCGYAEPGADTGMILGTLSYIAPEQARGEEVQPRSDVFGLGSVLYFLLTGKAPYQQQAICDLYQAAVMGSWDHRLLDQTPMPAQLRAITVRALAPNANDRYASALHLAQDLEAFVNRPRKVAAALAAALLLTCLAVLVACYTRPNQDEGNTLHHQELVGEVGLTRVPSKLAVEVMRKKNGQAIALEDAVPVMTGNELRLSAHLPARQYGAFVHFSEGKWTLLQQEAAEPAPRKVSFPREAGARVPLLGKAGPEFLLFCGRMEMPVKEHDVEALFADISAFPPIANEQAVFTFNEQELKQWHRGVLGKPTKSMRPEDVAHRQLDRLRSALRKHYDVYSGVLFIHKGPED